MADDGNVLTDLDNAARANGEDTQPIAGLISQYVKDLSVENPKAPESFQWRDQPEMDVQFNIGAQPKGEQVTEVELKINVNAITPGLIATEMTASIPEPVREKMIAMIPLGRMGDPRDVANLVHFLSTDASAYIQGDVIGISGGFQM